jgi:hypothetical protein
VNQQLLRYNTGTSKWENWTANFLTSYTETDPTVPSHVKAITTTNISNWNTAYGWGNHATAGYLTSLPAHNHDDRYVELVGDTMTGALVVNAPVTVASTIKFWKGGGTVASNIGIGEFTLSANTTGTGNVGIGQYVLGNNTTGASNVAIGSSALVQNTTGGANIAIGAIALYANVSGGSNVAIGTYALINATSSYNTVMGHNAFAGLTTGYGNTGLGFNVGAAVSTGVNNLFLGNNAGTGITTGSGNVVLGSISASRIATASSWMVFADGLGNERFAVSPNGNVLIGQTSDNGSDRVQVSGSVRSNSFFVSNATTPLIMEAVGLSDVWMKNAASFNIANQGYDRYNLRVINNGRIVFGAYTSTSSFSGTMVGLLGFDNSGNVLTVDGGGFASYVHNHDSSYYTKTQLNTSGAGGAVHWDNVTGKPGSYTPSSHNHDDRYYTESEVNGLLGGKADWGHTHDDRYYTEGEVNSLLSGKSDNGHTHDDRYYTEGEVTSLLSGKSDNGHNHDDRYYTESEVNGLLGGKADWGHTHDDRYYTESEVNSLLSGKSDNGHTHDSRYYPKSDLNNSGAGAAVHWGNITNAPGFILSENDPYGVSGIGLSMDNSTTLRVIVYLRNGGNFQATCVILGGGS